MSENESVNQPNQDDVLNNLKAEFQRKTDNQNQQLMELQNQLRMMNDQLSRVQSNGPQPIGKTHTVPDPLTEPEQYANYITNQMEARVNSKLATQQKQQAELSTLVNTYPELQDGNSELSRTAIQMYNNLSEDDKARPTAYRLAVQSAAADLGLLPVNKRVKQQQNNESEGGTIMSNNDSANTGNRKSAKKGEQIDQRTLDFAKMLGRDLNDPKVMEGLKKAAARKQWSKYNRQGKGEE